MNPRSVFQRSARRRGPELVRNEDAGEAELFLYNEIGYWGIQAKDFIAELRGLGDVDTIHVRINSPGGDVFDGNAIANALRQHSATVITHVDALAASIASVIALAGDEVRMADNAYLMIHNAWTIAIGNAEELRHGAAVLEKIDLSIVDAYLKKTGASKDQVNAWMAAESWFSASEAKDEGFIDAVENETPDDAKASAFDLSVYSKVPAALLARREDAAPGPKQLERALRDAGCSRAEAKAILAGGLKSTSDEPRDASESDLLSAGQALLASLHHATPSPRTR